MSLRVIGAGVGRTGTTSLKLALEQLLGGRCYHMHEVFPNEEHIPLWHQAALGEMPNWSEMFAGWSAAVDWPASAFWPELASAFPNALLIFSYRDPDAWWQSASNTIFPATVKAEDSPWRRMISDLFKHRFTEAIENRDKAIAAFNAHNAQVRATAPRHRLVEWQAGDGWEPICRGLGLPVPDAPFPHENTTSDFKSRVGKTTPSPDKS
ncbi:MAG: sulfotransferase family protein [Pseudomonadota bacterium]